MNTDNLLHTIYKNGEVFHCFGANTKTVLRAGNCYYIMNTGSLAYPFYIGKNIDTKKEFTIGNNMNLVDFIVKCDKKKTFVLCGINRNMGYMINTSVNQQKEKLEKKKVLKEMDSVNCEKNGYYNVDNLVIAKFARSKEDSSNVSVTEQKYIFEKMACEGKNKYKYREIFTGFEVSDELFVSKIPYVVEIQLFIDYFPSYRGKEISKMDLIFFLDDINFSKKKGFLSRLKRK